MREIVRRRGLDRYFSDDTTGHQAQQIEGLLADIVAASSPVASVSARSYQRSEVIRTLQQDKMKAKWQLAAADEDDSDD